MNKRHRIGSEHPLYTGGKTHDSYGYIQLSSKAWGNLRGKREHRVVMESIIGRDLMPDEIVHHKNGDPKDNRPENLSLETRASHNRLHGNGSIMTCSICGKGRWYSPALAAKLTLGAYRCRACYEGRSGVRSDT